MTGRRWAAWLVPLVLGAAINWLSAEFWNSIRLPALPYLQRAPFAFVPIKYLVASTYHGSVPSTALVTFLMDLAMLRVPLLHFLLAFVHSASMSLSVGSIQYEILQQYQCSIWGILPGSRLLPVQHPGNSALQISS